MIQIDRRYLRDAEHIATFHIGSVLSGGGSAPEPNAPEVWADMVDRFQRVALSTRLAIPLLYGTDAVHGHNNLYGATIFPHNIGLGAADDPELVRSIGEAIAVEIRATGPRWTFAPCLAVARNERWGRTFESAGEHPALAATLASARERASRRRADAAIGAGDGEALSRRRRYDRRCRPGRHRALGAGVARHPPATVRRCGGRRCRLDHGELLELERHAVARERLPVGRGPERRARLRGLRGQRLARDQPARRRARLLLRRASSARSGPAST